MRLYALSILLALLCAPALAAQEAKLPYSTEAYSLSSDDRKNLARLEEYLSGVQTVSSEFFQTAPNGEMTEGKFLLQRPGKLRMEYSPPTPVLMVTSGSDIVYYDRELDQISRIGLDSTLVGFLARDKVKFDESVRITRIEHKDHAIRVSLIQERQPKDGMLTLEFSDNPLILRNMSITDSSGQVTAVSLNNARFNMPLPAELFVFRDPHLGGSRVRH